ncbi:MAG: hypothetical protein AAFW65_05150 [Pseudomonadota bacterium]
MIGLAALPAAAQVADKPVMFGDDTSEWANDGECDDPRFIGNGMTNTPLVEADRFHDATDCRTAFEAGTIRLVPEAVPGAAAAIDFGDDSSTWSGDGECDDPRFGGDGMTSTVLLEADRRRDATDCRAAFEAGTIYLLSDAPQAPQVTQATPNISSSGVDFGTDDGAWANDGECDDPRFIGPGMTETILMDDDRMRDASDCQAAFEADTIRLRTEDDAAPDEGSSNTAAVAVPAGLDFGDNSSRWARDGECDDPRFEGSNAAAKLLAGDLGRDADDCRSAFTSGGVTLAAGTADTTLPPARPAATINFGDNSSDWARDSECDDPRFEGAASAAKLDPKDIRRDALDCRAAYENGRLRYIGD